jgi:hypothetical protein
MNDTPDQTSSHPEQPHPVPVYGPPSPGSLSAADQYRQARRSALLRTQIESSWTADLNPSYGHIVLVCGDWEPGQLPPDYSALVWHDPAGALWLRVGMDSMHSLLTVKVLPIGLAPRDRDGTEVVYDGPVAVGDWGWFEGGYMPLHAGDNSILPHHPQVPFCPVPATEGWSARVQVVGREESRQLGQAWLDTLPEDGDDDTPWPELPDPVEHWWVSFYRMTWPGSGTDRPGEEDIRAMVGSLEDYHDPEPRIIGYQMSDGKPAVLQAYVPASDLGATRPWRPVWRTDPTKPYR